MKFFFNFGIKTLYNYPCMNNQMFVFVSFNYFQFKMVTIKIIRIKITDEFDYLVIYTRTQFS